MRRWHGPTYNRVWMRCHRKPLQSQKARKPPHSPLVQPPFSQRQLSPGTSNSDRLRSAHPGGPTNTASCLYSNRSLERAHIALHPRRPHLTAGDSVFNERDSQRSSCGDLISEGLKRCYWCARTSRPCAYMSCLVCSSRIPRSAVQVGL